MSLQTKISEELKTAMKEKNTVKLSALRVLKSEVQRLEQSASGKVDLTDGDIVKVVKKLIEGVKETTNNPEELAVYTEYLPKQLSESEIRTVISVLKQSGLTNLGDYMKHFKTQYDGLYDGKTLSSLVKEML